MTIFKTPFFLKHKELILNTYYGVLIVVFFISVYKDILYAPPMPRDLRNRVVGARMIKDGVSPYFYIWKAGGPIRYYDIYLPPNSAVSRITASPFFHSIFSVVADMPQLQLNMLWMLVEYLSLIACLLLIAFSLSKEDRIKKMLIIASVAVAFTYTVGWKIHIWTGQNYIFTPLLIAACFFCLKKKECGWLPNLLFGIFAAMVILIKPVALLFFVPLLLFAKQYLKQGLFTLGIIASYIIFVLSSPVQTNNWSDYFKAVQVHIKLHQNLITVPVVAYDHLSIKHFEGIDMESGVDKERTDKLEKKMECSNLFGLYNYFSKVPLTIKAMTIISIVSIFVIMLPLLWFIKQKKTVSVTVLFLIGFIVYDTYTFCSPITRLNYYWVEYLLPLLLIAFWMKQIYILPIFLLAAGLLLNIFAPTWIPIRQNIGQIIIVAALLCQVYRPILFSFLNESKWKVKNNISWL